MFLWPRKENSLKLYIRLKNEQGNSDVAGVNKTKLITIKIKTMKIKTIILATSAILAASASIASTVPHKNIRLSHDHKPSHLTEVKTDIRDADPLARDLAISSPVRHSFKNRLLAKSAGQLNALASTCATTAELAAVSGGARNDLMKTQDDYTCFEDNIWTTPTSDMQSLFNESAMIDIANEARALALSYDGTSANKLRFFVAYLRSGKWTREQAGNSAIIGSHGSALDSAIVSFLDAFAANAHYYQSDETHAYLAKEVMILMYTTEPADRYRYLPLAVGILDAYVKEWGSNGQKLVHQNTYLHLPGQGRCGLYQCGRSRFIFGQCA